MALDINIKDKHGTLTYTKPLYLSSMGGNSFSETINVNGKSVDVELINYMPAAAEGVVEAKDPMEQIS